MNNSKELVVCVVHPNPSPIIETFICAQIEKLPGKIFEVIIDRPISHKELRLAESSFLHRAVRRFRLEMGLDSGDSRIFARFLKKNRVGVVLAHYGPTAVACLDACLLADIPLVPHFHGFDASVSSLIEEYHDWYNRLFKTCPAIIAVSKTMVESLIRMGAPKEKIHIISCGVDTSIFAHSKPNENAVIFIGVGRFVEKKAPFLTILAFNQALRDCPEAKLIMVGDGILLDQCKVLVQALGIAETVELPGKLSHLEVAKRMKQARAFVQHSIRAPNGDSEGLPVAILEACASGLPVVATKHAGIPEAVIDGVTGLLVNEYDIKGMSEHMITLAKDPDYAGQLGRKATEHIRTKFEMSQSIERLYSVLNQASSMKRIGRCG